MTTKWELELELELKLKHGEQILVKRSFHFATAADLEGLQQEFAYLAANLLRTVCDTCLHYLDGFTADVWLLLDFAVVCNAVNGETS